MTSVFTTIEPPLTDDRWASLWQWVDEASLDAETRRRWIDNGLRVGVISEGERVAESLRELAPSSDVVGEFLESASVATSTSGLGEAKSMRLGRRYELPLRKPLGGQRVFLVREGGETLGRRLESPQPLLAAEPRAGAEIGQIRLRLRPEIQYGAMRQSFTPSRAGIRVDQRRNSWSLPDLQIDPILREGSTLLIAPTQPPIGLGKSFLTETLPDQSERQTVLRLRIDHVPKPEDLL